MVGPRALFATAWHSKAQLMKLMQVKDPAQRAIRPVLSATGTNPYQALPAENGGEDALFHTQHAASGQFAFGLADGVGGWTREGVDPAVFSKRLLGNIYNHVAEVKLEPNATLAPVSLLEHSYDRINRERNPRLGSSTALVGVLEPTNSTLTMAQLGDSTYTIFRNRTEVHFHADEQTHGFNMPYQLTASPDQFENSGNFLDYPKDARVNEFTLRPDDIVVLGTDGVFDNLFLEDVTTVLKDALDERRVSALVAKAQDAQQPLTSDTVAEIQQSCLSQAAQAITSLAVLYSVRPDYQSPFAKRSLNSTMHFNGGKVDDTTVMLLWWKPQLLINGPLKAKL
ncbi:Protein phosphatase 2C 7 [Dimargaris xerosporica]|nr:Protein phosphatase 2C 7 [Dimargaris xerosporica]